MLIELQRANPPFGGFLGIPEDQLARIFLSPGPLFDPQGPEPDYWRFAKALHAAGFRAGDTVLNACAHHLTPLGFMFDEAARAIGCRVIPSGVGNTELQVSAARGLGATAYCGTPSFLRIILDKAVEMGLDPSTDLSLRRAFVAAEMLPESLRASLQAFGLMVLQGYGTADLGCLGYECSQLSGFHVPDAAVVEIVDPTTGRRLPPGEPGEVVATVNSRTYPLLRFGTGDLSALDEAPCACGRTSPRLVRIMGRVGDAIKVRGMFVHPRQLDEVMARFPEVQRYQAVVDRIEHHDVLILRIQLTDGGATGAIAEAVREVLHVRPDIEVVPEGLIADDAKTLIDQRTWT
jgi:phenylacetate-CoA ligase